MKKKIRVGVVGEIYVKYARLGNNDLEQFLYDQGCEVCLPGVMGFAAFKLITVLKILNFMVVAEQRKKFANLCLIMYLKLKI